MAVARGRIVARAAPTADSAEVVIGDRARVVLDGVERDARGREWLRGRAAGDQTVYLPRSAQVTNEVSIGAPLKEFILTLDSHGDVDLRAMSAALTELRANGRALLWASIATPEATNDKDAAARTLRVGAARVALVAAHVPRDNITTGDDQTLDAAMRVRVFGK